MPTIRERFEKFIHPSQERATGRSSVGDFEPRGLLVASSQAGLPPVPSTLRNILESKGIIEKTKIIDGTVQFQINYSLLGNTLPDDFTDWKNYLDLYYYNPQVGTATDLKQSLIWQMGYDLEGDDANVKKCVEYLISIDGDKTIRDDSFWALLFGNMYWHIEDGGVLKALNPMAVGIELNLNGSIKSYKYQPTFNSATATYSPEEILHLRYNAKPWDVYGCSPYRKFYPTAKIVMDMESDLPTIVKRRADPPIAVKIGEPSGPNRVSDDTYLRKVQELKQRKTGDDIFHDGVYQFEEVYKSGGTGTIQTVEPLIDHFMMNLVAGLSVPEIALGHGGTTTMATAEYQERILEAEIRAYQRTIKRFHESYIFPLAGVPVGKVKLNWRPMSPEDKAEISRQVIGEIQTGIISPEYARTRLGYPPEAGKNTVIAMNLVPYSPGSSPAMPDDEERALRKQALRKIVGERKTANSKPGG